MNSQSHFATERFGRLLALAGLALSTTFSAWTYADTLSKIRNSGEFVLGHRESSSPFSFIDSAGNPGGYSVDLCLKIFDQVKLELKRSDLKVRYVALKPADRIPAVKEGRVDVECGSTTNTVVRQKDVAFSYTTFMAGARILVKKSSNVKSLNGLRGKKMIATEKTTTADLVKKLVVERNLGIELVYAKDHAEAFRKLDAGEVVAVANDDALLVGLVAKSSNPDDYDFIDKYLSVEPYGIMHRKDDPAFTKVIDQALANTFSSGQIKAIYAKWFESGSFKLVMNQYMKENIRLPNKYGVQ
ncbi:MAG: amino acid ABC transporter substrate-binding protein [Betaproteobacteria bacterium]|nr:MAG: amino acid ABC transporter substrate-binding protein [Betaproteobacteria bacterium]